MRAYVAVMVLVLVAALAIAAPALAVTEKEAAQAFQRGGCTSCHNGVVAPKFEQTVKLFQEWAKKYPNIDAAVAAESKHFKPPAHAYKSYDELMNAMRSFSPSISDKDFKTLYEFYKMVFEEAKKSAGGATGGKAGGGKAGGAAKQISLKDAMAAFQRGGCTSCHNGVVAPKFDKIVELFKEWARKYPSLDAAVRAESKHFRPPAHAYGSYDELMKAMRSFSPSMSDKDYEIVYKFFEQVFQQAKGSAAAGGAGGAGKTSTTTTSTTSTTTTSTSTTTTFTTIRPTPTMSVFTPPSVTTPNPSQQAVPLFSNAALIGVALLIISVIIAALAFLRR